MSLSRNMLLFLLLCAIWGSTWIGIKAGIDEVPPLFFAGTRFTVAGAILLAMSACGGEWVIERSDWPRLAAASTLMIALCYGALFWGMLYINSGTAAVLELGLTPIALLGFALLFREERFTRRKLLAIMLGVAGLLVLFGRAAAQANAQGGANGFLEAMGALAVASAAITYGWGSVIARPLLRKYQPTLIAGGTTFLGGAMLLAVSLAVEPGAGDAMNGDWGLEAWAGWAFLVIFGSLIGYNVYIRLLRDIGPSRAGMYAFVSPVIAVLLGAAVRGETVTLLDLLGMSVLLFAAWIAMSAREATIDARVSEDVAADDLFRATEMRSLR